MKKNRKFRVLKDGNKNQLILFPYAGGNINSFSDLDFNILSEGTRVVVLNYPGHEANSDDLISSIEEFRTYYSKTLEELISLPTWLLGFSLGAQIVSAFISVFKKNKFIKGAFLCSSPAPTRIKELDESNYSEQLYSSIKYNPSIKKLKINKSEKKELEKAIFNYYLPVFKADIDLFQSCKLNRVDTQESLIPAYVLWSNEDTSLVLKDLIAWTHFFKYTKFQDFFGGHLFLNDKSSALNLVKLIKSSIEHYSL